MRIAMIAPPWVSVPPPAYGGTEAVIDQLCRGLAGAGHDVTLFATGDSTCPVTRRWTYERAQIEDIGNAAIELRHLLHAYANLDDFDVVHDHTLVGPVLAAEREGLAVVTTNHGPFNAELHTIYQAISRRVPLIAISHRQAADAQGIQVARVIHHGVNLEQFPVGRGQGDYLLFLGRMAPSKGVHLAAAAAREAGAHLVIAAKMREKPEREYFEREVRPLLSPSIEFIGEASFDEKVALIGDATALLNPIQWEEPFGMVMIESLACGTPVIAMRRGAVPEIVDHGATGFICTDTDELPAAIDAAPSLVRAACRATVEERFSTERMVEDHLEVYKQAIREAREPVGATTSA